jgi:hypothetical protein
MIPKSGYRFSEKIMLLKARLRGAAQPPCEAAAARFQWTQPGCCYEADASPPTDKSDQTGSPNVRFAPKAADLLRRRQMTRCAITGIGRVQSMIMAEMGNCVRSVGMTIALKFLTQCKALAAGAWLARVGPRGYERRA